MKPEKKILWVDSDAGTSAPLQPVLESAGFKVIESTGNRKEILMAIKTHRPDLILLEVDLEAPGEGVEIAEYLNSQSGIHFLFLTKNQEADTIQKAAKTEPAAYLLKPVAPAALIAQISLTLHGPKRSPRSILLKEGTVYHQLNLKEILWIKSEDIYIEIMTLAKKYVRRESLNHFLKTYPYPGLKRVHRSFIINLNHIQKIEGDFLWINGQQIPISRKYRKEIFQFFSRT